METAYSVSNEANDEQIILRVQSGAHEEFRYLIGRYQNTIYSLVARQVGDQEVAKELTQDIFVRAFRGLKNFRAEARFSTWLTRIALNVCNSYFKSKRYRASQITISLDHPELELESEKIEPEAYRREEIEALRSAIARLSPRLRDVVTLCAIEGKSYQVAAEILGIPYGTVCSRLNAAQHKLRKSLQSIRI